MPHPRCCCCNYCFEPSSSPTSDVWRLTIGVGGAHPCWNNVTGVIDMPYQATVIGNPCNQYFYLNPSFGGTSWQLILSMGFVGQTDARVRISAGTGSPLPGFAYFLGATCGSSTWQWRTAEAACNAFGPPPVLSLVRL